MSDLSRLPLVRPCFDRGRSRVNLCLIAALSSCAVVIFAAGDSRATVFHSRSEIGQLAFPNSDHVKARDVFLSPGQRTRIEQLAGSSLGSDLLTIYEGYRSDGVVGYALLDTHTVRTLSETLLVVLDASGTIAATYVMAFHEPLDYLPSDRWRGLLAGRHLTEDLRVGRAIVGITGSTISSRAVVGSVRRSLAIYQVLLASH